MPVSPSEYMKRYTNLTVPPDVDNGCAAATVNVHCYRNNGLRGNLGTQAAVKGGGPKDALVQKLKELLKVHHLPAAPTVAATANGKSISVDVKKVVRTFVGKGSPDEISDILWLARRLHLVEYHNIVGGTQKHVRLDATWSFQHYCDDYIGLDCNGFVGNYVQHVMERPNFEPSTRIQDYPPRAKHRAKIDEIQPLDILIWTDYGHIAIIDSVDAVDADGSRTCTVVESTASFTGGLHCGPYTFKPHGKTVSKEFRVDRHNGGGANTVYLIGLL